METKANNKDLIVAYREANPQERLDIVFDNYHIFPKMIRKMKKKIQYKIKAEHEYIRSRARGELGLRVQTSSLSDTTADEAVANAMLEESFSTGVVEEGILRGIENAQEYEADIRMISIMKDDYELVEECIEDLSDTDCSLMKAYLVQRKYVRDMAYDFNLSYDTAKRRVRYLKEYIREDVIDCIEMNCRR